MDVRTYLPYSVHDAFRPVNRYRRIGLLDTGPSNAITLAAQNARELRTRHGWSLAEAAKEAGIGKSTLAQLEAGTANPSLETLWAVARAYGVPVGSLIGSVQGRSRLVKAGQRSSVQAAHHSYQIQMLLSLGPLTGIDVTLLETEPGEPRVSQPHLPGSIEHVFVMQGSLRISPGDGTTTDLGEGDFLSFPSGVEHIYETLVPKTRAIVIMQYS
jgi:transcriptional regulator with XRE-family HTH domain